MMSTPTSPQEIQSALRHPFRPSRASPPRPHHHQPLAARSPRVIRFGDEVDSDLEMFEPDDDDDGKAGLRDGKKEQVWVKEMLQELVRPPAAVGYASPRSLTRFSPLPLRAVETGLAADFR